MGEKFENGYALLIGAASEKNIEATAKDAEALEDILENQAQYPFDQILRLSKHTADKNGIVKGFQWLEDNVNIDSTVVIYYGGHGAPPEKGYCDEYHLRPWAFDKKNSESVLTATEFRNLFNRIKAGKLVLFLNCCHAEGTSSEIISLDGKQEDEKSFQKEHSKFINALDAGHSKVIISASQSDEKSYIQTDNNHTLFGEKLIEAMKGAGSQDEEYVTLASAYNYVEQQVRVKADELGKDQNVSLLGSLGGFNLSRNIWKKNQVPILKESSESQSFKKYFEMYDEGEEEIEELGRKFCKILQNQIENSNDKDRGKCIKIISAIQTHTNNLKRVKSDQNLIPTQINRDKIMMTQNTLRELIIDFRYGSLIKKIL